MVPAHELHQQEVEREPPPPTLHQQGVEQEQPQPPLPPIQSQLQAAAAAAAATKIQSAYRAHLIRTLYRTLSSVDSDARRVERLIQRQDTVDALRSSRLERARIEEELMRMLLRLDSVPGSFDPAVREGRRKVSRRIVGLQEIVDGVCSSCSGSSEDYGDQYWWWWWCEKMEEEVCKKRGGEELDSFCANYLGFRCLERFLHEP